MSIALGLLLLLAGVVLLILGSRLYGQPKVGEQISHWQDKLPLPGEPPQRFYSRLYQAFKASLQDKLADGDQSPIEVVLTGMGFGPHRLFATPSLYAERPLYLLVRYKHLRCYIYAGQTPTGLFISAWGYSDYLAGEGQLQRVLPILRAIKYFQKQTLFQYDAALMFLVSVHEILHETINACLQEKGLKPLEEMEKRPILHAFYQNPFYRERGLFDFGRDRNDLHTHANLFGNSSRAATPTTASTPADNRGSDNGNVNASQVLSFDMSIPGTAPQAGHDETIPAVRGISATPAAPSSPFTPPTPEPLFSVDGWTTDTNPAVRGKIPAAEDSEDA